MRARQAGIVAISGFSPNIFLIPAGTSRIQKTVTLGTAQGEAVNSVPFLWEYQRLFNITGRTALNTNRF